MELICKLRVLEEPNFVFSIVQSDATDASSSVELDSSLDQRECSSDTESTNQWIQFNQGFLGDDDRISDGMLSCASSMSQSYFTGMETVSIISFLTTFKYTFFHKWSSVNVE